MKRSSAHGPHGPLGPIPGLQWDEPRQRYFRPPAAEIRAGSPTVSSGGREAKVAEVPVPAEVASSLATWSFCNKP